MTQYYHHNQPFTLEFGDTLPSLTIAYDTYGTLNADASNVVWVCHALTANSDVASWWQGTVVPGGFLDPAHRFVICANILGSPYGSTGPMSANPETGEPYYDTFPRLTIRDICRAHALLADALGITHIDTLIGSSVGGFQALQWAVDQPNRFNRLILIATAPKASPWTIALDETQRMAIKADNTWGQHRPDAARAGLAAARAIGLLSYRGPRGYNLTQQDPTSDSTLPPDTHRACTYQQHQGDKLVKRFDAYSYLTILDTFDTHDIGRSHGGVTNALAKITAQTLVIGISTDIVFLPDEMRALADAIPHAKYAQIDSPMGHDGFLIEHRQLADLLIPFMTATPGDKQQNR